MPAAPPEIREMVRREIDARRLPGSVFRRGSRTLIALGTVELVFGILALVLPYLSSLFFIALLGGLVMLSGLLEIVGAVRARSGGHGIAGAAALLAGFFISANPFFGLNLLTAAIAAYFIANGAARLVLAALTGDTPWARWTLASGLAAVFFGIVLLLWGISPGAAALGILVGANIIVSGAINVSLGQDVRRSL